MSFAKNESTKEVGHNTYHTCKDLHQSYPKVMITSMCSAKSEYTEEVTDMFC